jgi:hypothetical protein
MGLESFLSINMPYGLRRNEKGEWATFNREYMQLGMGNIVDKMSINYPNHFENQFIYVKYKDLTETMLEYLGASYDLYRDANGKICELRLFHPAEHPRSGDKAMKDYFERLRLLATLEVDKL